MSELLWTPSEERVKNSNMYKFIGYINQKYGQKITNYQELWNWSTDKNHDFWNTVFDFCNVIYSDRGKLSCNDEKEFWNHRFFPDAKLNFAENLLWKREGTAFIFIGEDKERRKMSWAELYESVAKTATALKKAGVEVGDRVVGYTANMPETIIAALATISIGAVWASCSPDFGVNGALDRLKQVSPKVMFAVDGYYYKGKTFNNLEKITEIANSIDSLEKLVVIPYICNELPKGTKVDCEFFKDFKDNGKVEDFYFEQLPFNHPIYILFTSGTTGVPKCMVHGAGGTLLQHKKEQMLQCDIKNGDVVFYFTTCSWMMWNWQVSMLSCGVTMLLYEGMPMYPEPDELFKLTEEYKINFFGTSSKYLDTLFKADVCPKEKYDLSSLNAIGVTGSPLSKDTFKFVYDKIKKDVHLNVFAGGGDIISSFNMGNPISPVYAGEMQGRGLGMAVHAFDDDGKDVPVGVQGKLVCVKPFVSQPIKFWGDVENKRLIHSYFEEFPGVWSHGDWYEITEHGGSIITGRADAVLNPSGIRIGTAEIYEQVQKVYDVLECCAIGQKWNDDERVILFVVLRDGEKLTEELIKKIKDTIRSGATPRHVPAKIIQVPAIPKTKNGKITEIAVKYTTHGIEVKNKDSLEDASVLDYFKDLEELKS